MVTVHKRIRRKISRILNEQGQWIDTQEGIFSTFVEHFKALFTKQEILTESEVSRSLSDIKIPKLKDDYQATLSNLLLLRK